jgi:putative inorganic carbon (hco3(-)) transporter
MRAAILIGIVAVLCCIAVVRPRVGLFAYVWFALMRPDALAWAAGDLHFSLYLAVATLIGSVRFIGASFRLIRNPFSLLLLGLQLVFFISALTAIDPSLSAAPIELQTNVVVMALLQVVLVQSMVELRDLLMVMGLSLGVIAIKYGAYALVHGGVVFSQGYVGFLSDNNNLALALVMAAGLCWHLRMTFESRWARLMLTGVVGASIITVIMTHSRGGAVSLAVVGLMIAWQSKHKLTVIVVLTTISLGAVYLVRDTYLQRMSTLKDPIEESSARNRIMLSKAGWRLAQDYPVLGVGFGGENEREIIGRYLDEELGQAFYLHNTYLQVLADSGFVAGALYIALLWGAIYWLGRSAARARTACPEWRPLPLSIQTALTGYAVGSCFLSRVTFDFTYMLLMSAASLYVIETTRSVPVRDESLESPRMYDLKRA